MAKVRARMLHWKISRSEKLARCTSDSCRMFYTWLIAHCDNLGRAEADAHLLRHTVVPKLRHIDDEMVESYLLELHTKGLILLYEHEGLRYLKIIGWERHQKIKGNMTLASDFPDPVYTACELRTNGVRPEGEGEVEGKGKGEGEVEGKGAMPVPTPSIFRSQEPESRLSARSKSEPIARDLGESTPVNGNGAFSEEPKTYTDPRVKSRSEVIDEAHRQIEEFQRVETLRQMRAAQ